jgi:starch-binding outer membrane protein, SusD/RagB family
MRLNTYMQFTMLRYNMRQILMLLALILLCSDCKKILHEEEISIGKITNYDQLLNATGGVYGILTKAFFGDRNYFYNANLKGDDLCAFPGNYGPYYNHVCDISISNYIFSDEVYYLWKIIYQAISSANNIICQYNPATLEDRPTREMLGEIYFIRAYCYFRLTRTYGQVPLIGNIDINYNVPKPSFTEIYKFIESDLKTSMELLPKNIVSSRIPFVTPHRGSAKAILAEVYLSWAGYPCKDESKYTLAAQQAGETIDSASFFGLGLVNDFAFLWDKAHYYNSESVFSIYDPDPAKGNLLQTWSNIYSGWYGSSASVGWYLTPGLYVDLFFYGTEINFFNIYPDGYRKEITFFTTIYVPPGAGADTGYIHIVKASPCVHIAYRKFYYEPTTRNIFQYYSDNDTVGTEKNFFIGSTRAYLFRYAHTLLTYAEAMARSGQLNSRAYEYVNQIRRRARHLDLNSPSGYDLPKGLSIEAFVDSVVWERAWELCGEPEGRWFDLIRLEKVEDLPKMRNPFDGGPPSTFDKSAYFFLVPPLDTVLNPNLRKK